MNIALTQQIVPISDFRIHQGRTLEKMANGPVYLAQRSKPVAVLVAAEQWDQAMSRLQTLEAMFAQLEIINENAEYLNGEAMDAPEYSELFQEKRSFFREIFMEAIEEIGISKAITEGLESSYASEDEVFAILDEDEA